MGKTPPSCRRRTRSGKHPHLRRDNRNARLVRLAPPETSPPAWGKPPRPTLHLLRLGNIPTYVGKTRIPALSSRPFGKHPHLRGENSRDTMNESGKLRNIPTCVGKTRMPLTSMRFFWKHPHLRGENAMAELDPEGMMETSPPAWGKLREEVDFDSSHWKHPHLRGENFLSVQ